MLQLYISENGEIIELSGMQINKKTINPVFAISSCWTRLFSHLPRSIDSILNIGELNLSGVLERFVVEANNLIKSERECILFNYLEEAYWPKYYNVWFPLFGTQIERNLNAFWLYIEYLCLVKAINEWLIPERKHEYSRTFLKPRDRFLKSSYQIPGINIYNSWVNKLINTRTPELIEHFSIEYVFEELTKNSERLSFMLYCDNGVENQLELWCELLLRQYLEEVFRYRTSQVGTELLIMWEQKEQKKGKYKKSGKNKVVTHLYKTKSFLSLAWIEILWAIDQGKYAYICEICGDFFNIEKPYTRKAYLCSDTCKKEKKIKNRGGIEAARQYFTEKKRESRKRAKDNKTSDKRKI